MVMAKPLPLVLKSPEIQNEKGVREELQRKLAEAPVEHAAALLSLYELVQTLHERGTLNTLRGLFGASDDIIGRISAMLNSPEVIRSVRNLIALAQIVGSVDPKLFESLRDAAMEVAEKNKHADGKPPGLWTIMKRADSEDSLRALGAATDFLQSLGRHMKQNSDNTSSH
jgi:uncharacterized protein YjgD (DUF1641 family)